MAAIQDRSQRPLGRNEVIGLLSAVLLGRVLGLSGAWPASEGWITLRYAEHFAAGHGLVWEPGPGGHILGTAAPGWAALVALARIGFQNALDSARALAVLFDCLAGALILLSLERRPHVARLALLLFALLPVLQLGAASGGEGPLLLVLTLWVGLCARSGRHAAAGALVGIATLVRPEAILLTPFALAFAARARAALLGAIGPVVALVFLAALLKLNYSPPLLLSVPSRFFESSGTHWALQGAEFVRLAFGGAAGLLLVPLLAVGLARAASGRSPLCVLTGFGLSILLIGVALRLSPADPMLHVARGAGVTALALALDRAWLARVSRAALPLALAGAVVPPLVRGAPLAPLPQQAELLDWAHEAELAHSSRTLYTRDAAALGYLTEARVLDGRGRVWLPALAAADRVSLLRLARPDYLLLEVAQRDIALLEGDDELAREYYPLRRFSDSGALDLFPDRAGLPIRAPRDLLLFRRRL